MNKMKIGDKVKMSDKNPNHLGNGVDAYAGMEGIVENIYDDGAFVLNCGSSILVVPMRDAYKNWKKGCWIYLNGELLFHKSVKPKTENVFTKILDFLF
jgi:hypothetical protein